LISAPCAIALATVLPYHLTTVIAVFVSPAVQTAVTFNTSSPTISKYQTVNLFAKSFGTDTEVQSIATAETTLLFLANCFVV
jgi:flagellar biosynthesis protein FlhB